MVTYFYLEPTIFSVDRNHRISNFVPLLIQSQSSSLWTESIVSNEHVNAHNALTKFSEWVKKKTDLPSNDHVMLLTRQVFNYNNGILYKTPLHTTHSYNNHVNTHNALTKFIIIIM